MKLCFIVLALTVPLLAQEEPADLDSSYESLKAAVEKKDAAGVKKYSTQASEIARKVIAGGDKDRIEHAKEIQKYADYALSATALTSTDSKTVMDLVETLEQQDPKSEYLTQVLSKYSAAARQAGHPEKAVAMAEKVAKSDPSNTEALLVVAEANLAKRPAVASDYASRAVAILSKKKGDEASLGRANYDAGLAFGAQEKWPQTNQSLQAALPTLKGNQQAMGYALFYLGMANYRLGTITLNKAQMKQALNYFEQCAAIPGPMQAQASQNVSAIRQQVR
jgi:tetratricopeptide (TPR) repeat protein